MRNAEYEALFKGLAQTHQLIRHRDDSPRFARIITSVDPMQRQMDLAEMEDTLLGRFFDKTKSGEQVLVIESLQTSYQDNKGDNYQHRRRGAFFVLEKPLDKKQAWRSLDRTEETGEQLLGAVLHHFQDDVRVRFQVGTIQADAVGPVGPALDWYGSRFDFEFFSPATKGLAYQPAVFISPSL